MQRLDRFLEAPINGLIWIACVATFLMMLHVTADVLAKYLFNYPLEGTIEIVSGYYMVIVVYLPLAYVARNEGHIIVELFTRKMGPGKLAGLDGVLGIVTLIYMTILTWTSSGEAAHRTIQGEVWETATDTILIWPSRWILPIGCGAMAIYVGLRILTDFKRSLGPAMGAPR